MTAATVTPSLYLHMPPPSHITTFEQYAAHLWSMCVQTFKTRLNPSQIYIVVDKPQHLPPPRDLVRTLRSNKTSNFVQANHLLQRVETYDCAGEYLFYRCLSKGGRFTIFEGDWANCPDKGNRIVLLHTGDTVSERSCLGVSASVVQIEEDSVLTQVKIPTNLTGSTLSCLHNRWGRNYTIGRRTVSERTRVISEVTVSTRFSLGNYLVVQWEAVSEELYCSVHYTVHNSCGNCSRIDGYLSGCPIPAGQSCLVSVEASICDGCIRNSSAVFTVIGRYDGCVC